MDLIHVDDFDSSELAAGSEPREDVRLQRVGNA
jgi:hypothetical protein